MYMRLVIFIMVLQSLVFAAPGDLDMSFGGNGIVTTAISDWRDEARSVAIQSDGKILVAGESDGDFALVRYDTNGSLDTSFDGDGIVTTPIGIGGDYAYSVAIQSDAKIVAVGYSYNGSNYDFALVRYDTNGSLDTSFDGDGIVTTPIGSSDDRAQSVDIQSNGKIIAAGYSYNGSDNDFALVRYDTNGSRDTSFGTDGIVTTALGSGYDYAYGVAIQSDGKIIVAGSSWNGSRHHFALVRYDTSGNPDTSFGTDGIVTTEIGNGSGAKSVTIQSNGRIVVAGESDTFNHYRVFTLVRYDTSGNPDTSFGADGIVTTSIRHTDRAQSIAIQNDGKIVAAGYSNNDNDNDFALVRYNPDGSLDTSFGAVTTEIGNSDDEAYSVAIQNDGKIMVVGRSKNDNDFMDFALVRYQSTPMVLTPIYYLLGM